jgi:hypothetical protein
MKYLKTFESYYSIGDYISSVEDLLKVYNISPTQLNTIINSYSVEIKNNFDDGKFPQIIADKISKDLELSSGGYLAHTKFKSPSPTQHSHSIN